MAEAFELDERFPADMILVLPLVERVAGQVMILTGSSDEVFKVKLALEESLTNAVRHGNKQDPRRYVSLRVKVSGRDIFMDVHDEGKGFDFERLPDPTLGERALKPSGLGVFLMRQYMYKVEFYDNGSGVRMNRKFPS